ncbi:hypothetical protein BJ165DRAFT_200385 [Panaeolus papilionaceus]|nr:hypothetical protein BJ165DRAFT_200385 [Panaeolus papilionaceus]
MFAQKAENLSFGLWPIFPFYHSLIIEYTLPLFYAPSTSPSMAYSHSIDDADPRITYSTAWDFITSDQYTMPQWSGTAHSTSTIGTTARLRFTGSAIAVICIIPTSGGGNGVSRASFSIDNGPAKEGRYHSDHTRLSSQTLETTRTSD